METVIATYGYQTANADANWPTESVSFDSPSRKRYRLGESSDIGCRTGLRSVEPVERSSFNSQPEAHSIIKPRANGLRINEKR
ncbi:hypothetical protein CGZ80_11630 [Rhodopirellula sp. MGV]|nr:hypothetical protein CGZ80_11630 [Rhodopirellula sp. MGV]PNY33927.1 hypothetical protein C2E31_26265 [Rhodopirellula baltica]